MKMATPTTNENRIKCGKCNTEFDLNKNQGCPLCSFGSNNLAAPFPQSLDKVQQQTNVNVYLSVPKDLKLKEGMVIRSTETEKVGSWGMFNSFFPGKAVLRILSHMQQEQNAEYIILSELINKTSNVVMSSGLSKLRGFPNNPKAENSIGRLVYHFIKTFHNMGLFSVQSKEKDVKNIWDEPWEKINITATKEGLEFAQLQNNVFDKKNSQQVLTKEERQWLLAFLKNIEPKGYGEISLLQDVFNFIKEGHNGNEDLWKWFSENNTFIEYVKSWSRKSNDPEAFEKQVKNLSPTFASGKIALLRELGCIKNKRNDYSIVGELE